MKELLENAEEFLNSGEDNLKKSRFNVAASDFFKAIVIMCDYLIYKNIKALPKNHAERFYLLKTHFRSIHDEISELFSIYTRSYNQKLGVADVLRLKEYSYGLKNRVTG